MSVQLRAEGVGHLKSTISSILTINGGSSSIRFAVFTCELRPIRQLAGKVERLGFSDATMVVTDAAGTITTIPGPDIRNESTAASFLLAWLESQPFFSQVRAVGHRVVHGMKNTAPMRITPQVLRKLRHLTSYDPEHLPGELALINAFARRHPKLVQVACFDTAFHRAMPRIAKILPIPRRYGAKGVERYGFHGLSYAYLMEELGRVTPAAAKDRIILAHLGSGASLAAVHGGRSIDTSMGFTPAAGLMMGTRSGDLDPGLLSFLTRSERMTPARFWQMVNRESGLLGVSGRSSDIRDLLAHEAKDVRAAEAVALFCYQTKKWIGAFAAALGGLDLLVFTGGIGENAPAIRTRICAGLGFLGVALNAKSNARNAPIISHDSGQVTVRVMRTDEELMIARSTCRLLSLGSS